MTGAQDILLQLAPFDRLYGLEVTEWTATRVRGQVPVVPQLTQPLGMVHGGVYSAIAEALASMGTNKGVVPSGLLALGQSNDTTFLRPVVGGHLNGRATRRHDGERAWTWDVDIDDDDGRTCAIARVVIAVRPPGAAPSA